MMEMQTQGRLSDEFVQRYAEREHNGEHPLLDAFNGLAYVVFKRTYARPYFDAEGKVSRTEEWHETVRRVVEGAQEIGAGLTETEMRVLYDHIWNLRAFPGGRMLWQLGTDNIQRLGGDSLVNCWFVNLVSVEDFVWMFNRLMLGGGVGFSVTQVERLGHVNAGYGVAQLCEGFDVDFIVPDNREGWGQLLQRVMEAHFTGQPFTYSVDAVRPEGAPIKTFGGKASGPGELVRGVDKISTILGGALGRHITTVEALDIANVIGSIVVSGNVRRSAQIALGSPVDTDFLMAKRWDLGGIPNHRAMSNNSVIVSQWEDIPDLFWEGYHGNGEAYGLVNVHAARRYGRTWETNHDMTIDGFNPCAEIPLAHRESCNLAEIVLPHMRSLQEMKGAAALLYKVQKAVAALPYLDPESDRTTNANMRLGLGVTGVAQATEEQMEWLDPTYTWLRRFDEMWSKERGWPTSIRLTTVKPSGTLSLLAGVTPGGHPGYSQYHIRRVRMAATDPILQWCQDRGYRWEWQLEYDGSEDRKTGVVEFPVTLPDHAVLAKDMTAIDQLKLQARLQSEWADNAVSVTVYYRPEELDGIRGWLRTHWGKIKSVSFLLHEDHGFTQAPLEAITAERYEEMVEAVEFSASLAHAHGISELLDVDCEGGACPIR